MAELTLSRPTFTPGLPALPIGVFLLLTVAWQAAEVGSSSCVHDEVSTQAHWCFTDYSREYQNIKSSPKRLCCGVDVETLRAFCSSYMDGMSCIERLRSTCPGSSAIEEAMTNLHGAETALKALCADDRIIEVYARHQSCITKAGPTTQHCIERYLNGTDNVRLLASVDTQRLAEFCRDMRGTLLCVQNNVRNVCGQEASELSAVLVKPMVRHSTKCDYSVVTKAPNYRQSQQPSAPLHEGSQRGTAPTSGCRHFSASLVCLLLCALLRTFCTFS